MDEAWERFDADPPKRLAVVVADLPGEGDMRTSRHLFVIRFGDIEKAD